MSYEAKLKKRAHNRVRELEASSAALVEALEAVLQGRPTKEPPRDMVAAYRNWLAFEKARAALKLAKGE